MAQGRGIQRSPGGGGLIRSTKPKPSRNNYSNLFMVILRHICLRMPSSSGDSHSRVHLLCADFDLSSWCSAAGVLGLPGHARCLPTAWLNEPAAFAAFCRPKVALVGSPHVWATPLRMPPECRLGWCAGPVLRWMCSIDGRELCVS